MREILEIRSSIRTDKLHERESLSAEARQSASAAITSRLLTLIDENKWRTIHCYLAFRSEVATAPLIETLLSREITVVVPWVEADGELSHHRLLGVDVLAEGPYGLPHPARNEFLATHTIDAVFLPLSAFDRSGNRLGYGKGFYDRFLQQLPASTHRIGLAFAIQEAESIPAMAHDQKLHAIVTEKEIIIIPAS